MSQRNFFEIKIADIKIGIDHRYDYVKKLCSDFTVHTDLFPSLVVSVSDEDMIKENKQYEAPHSDAYCEGICVYRAIAEKLPLFDGFVFHGAAVEIDGRGFVFAAPSGTGKSTHISLLLRNYPENVHIINGDKPVLRCFPSDGESDGEWRVCSTPWAGKEDMKIARDVCLAGIVLLSRGAENKISRVDPTEHFSQVIRQVYIPEDASARMQTLSLVDGLSRAMPFYHLECNISDNAAETSYNELKK